MSTKCSIAYGDEFHFYTDLMDDVDKPSVYLTIKSKCECNRHKTLEIPAHIWEAIRVYPSMSFDLAGLTDDQLLEMVTKEVEERLADYAANPNSLSALFGSLTYGDIESSKEEQIKNGLESYKGSQAVQKEVLAKSVACVKNFNEVGE